MSEKKLSRGITSTSNFCAHRLVFTQGRVVVKPTAGNYIFFSIFALIGLGIIAAAWLADGDENARIPMTVFGLIFGGAGFAGMFWKRNRLPEIDLMRRMFYPERRKYDPSDMTNLSSMQNNGIPLSELVKIEVSTRRVRGNKSSYTAYMLDLVFRDGYSCRLLSHGARKQFTEDAEKLAQVLNMPLIGLEETQRQMVSLKVGGIIQMIFSIFWLSICIPMMLQMIVPALDKLDKIKQEPAILIQIIFPSIFILVGVGMFIAGVRNVVKSLKNPQK
ncbi:MAG: hypothetical protein E7054_01180 [Lentisphaerae bacterium]|nr:hypothetical protein [Lentisphaerota bacterium]